MSGAGVVLIYVLAGDQKRVRRDGERGRRREGERVVYVREEVGTVV